MLAAGASARETPPAGPPAAGRPRDLRADCRGAQTDPPSPSHPSLFFLHRHDLVRVAQQGAELASAALQLNAAQSPPDVHSVLVKVEALCLARRIALGQLEARVAAAVAAGPIAEGVPPVVGGGAGRLEGGEGDLDGVAEEVTETAHLETLMKTTRLLFGGIQGKQQQARPMQRPVNARPPCSLARPCPLVHLRAAGPHLNQLAHRLCLQAAKVAEQLQRAETAARQDSEADMWEAARLLFNGGDGAKAIECLHIAGVLKKTPTAVAQMLRGRTASGAFSRVEASLYLGGGGAARRRVRQAYIDSYKLQGLSIAGALRAVANINLPPPAIEEEEEENGGEPDDTVERLLLSWSEHFIASNPQHFEAYESADGNGPLGAGWVPNAKQVAKIREKVAAFFDEQEAAEAAAFEAAMAEWDDSMPLPQRPASDTDGAGRATRSLDRAGLSELAKWSGLWGNTVGASPSFPPLSPPPSQTYRLRISLACASFATTSVFSRQPSRTHSICLSPNSVVWLAVAVPR